MNDALVLLILWQKDSLVGKSLRKYETKRSRPADLGRCQLKGRKERRNDVDRSKPHWSHAQPRVGSQSAMGEPLDELVSQSFRPKQACHILNIE